MLVKLYGADLQAETRYSPAKCIGARKETKIGTPDKMHISTSYVERSNLTMRMHMRRFTWLTNAFSKKVENHACAIALHTMFYNFVRIHQTLKVTPAMAAGVADKLWEIDDIVGVIEQWEAANAGPALSVHHPPVCDRQGLVDQPSCGATTSSIPCLALTARTKLWNGSRLSRRIG